jgi:hypothetical protein
VFLVVARMLGIEEASALAERCRRAANSVRNRMRSAEADRGDRTA